jgi:hypothetical protein
MALGPRSARCLSFASRAKRHSGSGPSAQTLGRMTLSPITAAREVIELHAFLEAWFRGELPKSEEAFQRLSRAWPPAFRLVSPEHQTLEAPALLRQTYEEHAAYPSLRIEVRDASSTLVDDGSVAIVVYEERHIDGGSVDARFCSALLADDESNTLAVWLHVHESRIVHPAMRPNPSLEPGTSTGLALGPRGGSGHHPPRGPSTTPAPAPQLKR